MEASCHHEQWLNLVVIGTFQKKKGEDCTDGFRKSSWGACLFLLPENQCGELLFVKSFAYVISSNAFLQSPTMFSDFRGMVFVFLNLVLQKKRLL